MTALTRDSAPANPETAFVEQYEQDYVARKAARELYRAIHPMGMHTNGPCYVNIEASHLHRLLSRWKKS